MDIPEARWLTEAVDAANAVCARIESIAATSEACSLLLLVAMGHRDALISLRSRSGAPAGDEGRRLTVAAEALAELRDIATAAAQQSREAVPSHPRDLRRHGSAGPPRLRRSRDRHGDRRP